MVIGLKFDGAQRKTCSSCQNQSAYFGTLCCYSRLTECANLVHSGLLSKLKLNPLILTDETLLPMFISCQIHVHHAQDEALAP
jgi:hypothetical protein